MSDRNTLRYQADGNPLGYWLGQTRGRTFWFRTDTANFYLGRIQAEQLGEVTFKQLVEGPVRLGSVRITLDLGRALVHLCENDNHGVSLTVEDFLQLVRHIKYDNALDRAKHADRGRAPVPGSVPAGTRV